MLGCWLKPVMVRDGGGVPSSFHAGVPDHHQIQYQHQQFAPNAHVSYNGHPNTQQIFSSQALWAGPVDIPFQTSGTFPTDIASIHERYSDRAFRPSRSLMITLNQQNNQQHLLLADPNGNAHPYALIRKPYMGDKVGKDVPYFLNTAVWLSGIPPEASLKEIFATFVGKIYAFSKSKPIPGVYDTSGASVTFASRSSAHNYLLKAQDPNRGIWIRGKPINVIWDKNHSRGLENPMQSRVVSFKVPMKEDVGDFIVYLETNLTFDLVEDTLVRPMAEGRHKIIYMFFSSIRGQSRAAMKCVLESANFRGQRHNYSAYYAPDPCESSSGWIIMMSHRRAWWPIDFDGMVLWKKRSYVICWPLRDLDGHIAGKL